MDPSTHLDHLRTDLARIAATPRDALGAPVAACPGWTVEDLLGHHEGVLRFATAQLRAAPGSDLVVFDPPDDDADRLDAFAAAADDLVTALAATDPAEHRPSWNDGASAAFWFRRMAQEAAVHRWDAEVAHTTPAPIDPALAIDGVDELGEVFLAHAGRRGITGTGETLHLHATDPGLAEGTLEGGEWMLTFHEGGVDVAHGHGKGDMAVRGPAQDLLLLVWNRGPVHVETFGDPDPLAFWARTVRI